MKAALLLVLPLPLATGDPDPRPLAQQPPGDEDVLRRELGGTINSLLSPCRFNLEAWDYLIAVDSVLGLEFLALIEGRGVANSDSFDFYKARLEKLRSDPDTSTTGIQRATASQSFHLEVGPTRTAQWCTSDHRYPSFLRTHDLELAYFAQEQRLDFQRHTEGLVFFEPRFLMSPLPGSREQLNSFMEAPWAIEKGPDAGLRITALPKAGDREWLTVEVGESPARLPFGCVWYLTGRGSRGGQAAFYSWTLTGRGVRPAGVMLIADEGKRFGVSVYRISEFEYLCEDLSILLPIGDVKCVRDLTGTVPASWRGLSSVPKEWRDLLTAGVSARVGHSRDGHGQW